MKRTRKAVLHDVTRLARGRSVRIARRWRRLAAKQLDAALHAAQPFRGERATAATVDDLTLAIRAAIAIVDDRHGRLYS